MIDFTCYPRLSRIQTPEDLRAFQESELRAVADELRNYLIESVGLSGGHFAAGLGVVELTIALHYLYCTPIDQLVWDVGHQTYPHKILTGHQQPGQARLSIGIGGFGFPRKFLPLPHCSLVGKYLLWQLSVSVILFYFSCRMIMAGVIEDDVKANSHHQWRWCDRWQDVASRRRFNLLLAG